MLLHVDIMSFLVGLMRRAICNCDLLHVDVMSEHVVVMRHAIFDCNINGAQSLIAIFGCDLFFGRGSFGRCLFRTLFRMLVHVDVMRLLVDRTTLMRGSDAVALLWTRLFGMPSLLDAVSFGRGCSYLDAYALPRTRMLLFL